MAAIHITEAEFARDFHAVLAKVRGGAEVVVEEDHRVIAVLKPSPSKGKTPGEILEALKARRSDAVMDDDFARDVEAGIEAYRQPWNPPSWD